MPLPLPSAPDQVLVDALPYIDIGYDENSKQAALSLIDEECKRYRPTKNYLAHLPTPNMELFLTDVMRTELDRIQQRQPMELMNMRRYELPGPPAGKSTDGSAWAEAVSNSQAQLEHQAIRISNLNLMEEYGAEAWKSYNSVLQTMLNEARTKLTKIKTEIQHINFDRKKNQNFAGDRLKALEQSWVGLVTKNYEIERACAELELKLVPLRQKYETELKDNSLLIA